jgi:hypothetical protein
MFLRPEVTIESIRELGRLTGFELQEESPQLLGILESRDVIQSEHPEELERNGFQGAVEFEQSPGIQPVCLLLQAMEEYAASVLEPDLIPLPVGVDTAVHGQRIYESLQYTRLSERIFEDDFMLEVRGLEPLLTSIQHPTLIAFVHVPIPGDRRNHLERENGGQGYHFHYATKHQGRTNVIMTYHPTAPCPLGKPASLYWEHHNQNKLPHVDPSSFGSSRKQRIYSATQPSLAKLGKHAFLTPSRRASIL